MRSDTHIACELPPPAVQTTGKLRGTVTHQPHTGCFMLPQLLHDQNCVCQLLYKAASNRRLCRCYYTSKRCFKRRVEPPGGCSDLRLEHLNSLSFTVIITTTAMHCTLPHDSLCCMAHTAIVTSYCSDVASQTVLHNRNGSCSHFTLFMY